MEELREIVTMFFASAYVKTILGLITVDFLVGVGAAVKLGEFQWRKLADFYRTNIIPFLLAYGGLYVGVRLVDPTLMGGNADVVSEAVLMVVWGAIVYHLVTSILTNLEELGISIGRPPES